MTGNGTRKIILLDPDGDGDLDLAFVGEIDDPMPILRNRGFGPPVVPGDLDGDGLPESADLGILLTGRGRCAPPPVLPISTTTESSATPTSEGSRADRAESTARNDRIRPSIAQTCISGRGEEARCG